MTRDGSTFSHFIEQSFLIIASRTAYGFSATIRVCRLRTRVGTAKALLLERWDVFDL